MILDNKRIFLAGATGSAGANILEYLLKNYPSTRIRALHRSSPDPKPYYEDPKVEYICSDLTIKEDCRLAVQGCDCVIMAAAYTGGSKFVQSNPLKYVHENYLMNINLLTAVIDQNIQRAVWLTSSSLYQPVQKNIKEDELDYLKDPPPIHFGFGWFGRFFEKYCRFRHQMHGTEILIARVSNIYGYYSRFDEERSNFIPALIKKAVNQIDPYEVWGSPDIVRDVVYAEDVAKAAMAMLEREEVKFDIFNIGTGGSATVKDAVNYALEAAGHKPSKIIYQRDEQKVRSFTGLDCSKAKEMLGWEPKYSLKEGIDKTTAWWIKNKDSWTR